MKLPDKIVLYSQEGCRACKYAENNLKKADGWEKYITIESVRDDDGIWKSDIKDLGVKATPTLVAFLEDEVIAFMEGSNNMSSQFFKNLVSKYE
jgi:hypothetical protein